MDREAIKTLEGIMDRYITLDIDERNAMYRAIEALKERKKGHWIDANYYFAGAYEDLEYYQCSECGEDSLEDGDFCPNCGADMRGHV